MISLEQIRDVLAPYQTTDNAAELILASNPISIKDVGREKIELVYPKTLQYIGKTGEYSSKGFFAKDGKAILYLRFYIKPIDRQATA